MQAWRRRREGPGRRPRGAGMAVVRRKPGDAGGDRQRTAPPRLQGLGFLSEATWEGVFLRRSMFGLVLIRGKGIERRRLGRGMKRGRDSKAVSPEVQVPRFYSRRPCRAPRNLLSK